MIKMKNHVEAIKSFNSMTSHFVMQLFITEVQEVQLIFNVLLSVILTTSALMSKALKEMLLVNLISFPRLTMKLLHHSHIKLYVLCYPNNRQILVNQ